MRVHAYISNHKTFIVECPKCRHAEERRVSGLSSGHPNPFRCACPCGAQLTVHLVGFRGGARKPVRLAASFARVAEQRPIRRFATVLDLSVKGMRVATEYDKSLRVGDEVQVALVLDDGQRTKLKCMAAIRRIKTEKDHTTVGVEFHPMSAHDVAILEAYLST